MRLIAFPVLLAKVIGDVSVLEAPSLLPDLASDLFPSRVRSGCRISMRTSTTYSSVYTSRDACATSDLFLPLYSEATEVFATESFTLTSPGSLSLCLVEPGVPTNAFLVPSLTISGVTPTLFTRRAWKLESFAFTGHGLKSGDRIKFVAAGADCVTSPVSFLCTDEVPICGLSVTSTKSSFRLSSSGWADYNSPPALLDFASYEEAGEYVGVFTFETAEHGIVVADVLSLYGVGCIPFYSCSHAEALAQMGRGQLGPTALYLPFEESPFTTERQRLNLGMNGEWAVEGGNGYSQIGKKDYAGNFGSDVLTLTTTVDGFDIHSDWTLCVYVEPLLEAGNVFEHVPSGLNVNISSGGFVNLNVPNVALNVTDHIMFLYPDRFTFLCAVHRVVSSSAGLIRVYLDNDLYVDSATVLGARVYEQQQFVLGSGFKFDELRIYREALSLVGLNSVDLLLNTTYTYPIEYLTGEVTVSKVDGAVVELKTKRGGSWDRFIVHKDLFKYEVHNRGESQVEIVAAESGTVDICWSPQGSLEFLQKAGSVQFQSYNLMPFSVLYVLAPVMGRQAPFGLVFKVGETADRISLVFVNSYFEILDPSSENVAESILGATGEDCGRVIAEFWSSNSATPLPGIRKCDYAVEGATWIVNIDFYEDSGFLEPGGFYQIVIWSKVTYIVNPDKPLVYLFARKDDDVTEVSPVYVSEAFAPDWRLASSAFIVKSFDEEVDNIPTGSSVQFGADVMALNLRVNLTDLSVFSGGEVSIRLIVLPSTTWNFKYAAKCSVGCESDSAQCHGLSCEYERLTGSLTIFNAVKLKFRVSGASADAAELLVSVRGLFPDTVFGFYQSTVGVMIENNQKTRHDLVWTRGYGVKKRPASPAWVAKLGVSRDSNLNQFKGEENKLSVSLVLPETLRAADRLLISLPIGYVCEAVLSSELWPEGWEPYDANSQPTENLCVYTAPEGTVWFRSAQLTIWLQVRNPVNPMSEKNYNNRWYASIERGGESFQQSFFSAQSQSALFKPRVGVLGEVVIISVLPVNNIHVGQSTNLRFIFSVEQAGADTLLVTGHDGFDLTSCQGEALENYGPQILSCEVITSNAVKFTFGDTFDAWLGAVLAIDVNAVPSGTVFGVSKALDDVKSWALVTYSGSITLDRSRGSDQLASWSLVGQRSPRQGQVLTTSELPGGSTAIVRFSLPSCVGVLRIEASQGIDFVSVISAGNLGTTAASTVASTAVAGGALVFNSASFSDSVDYEFEVSLNLPNVGCQPLPNSWRFTVDDVNGKVHGDIVQDPFEVAVVFVRSLTPVVRTVLSQNTVKIEFVMFSRRRRSDTSTDVLKLTLPSGFTPGDVCELNGVTKTCSPNSLVLTVQAGMIVSVGVKYVLQVEVLNPATGQGAANWMLSRFEKIGSVDYALDAAGTILGFSVTGQFTTAELLDTRSLGTIASEDALFAEVGRDDRPDSTNRVLIKFELSETLNLANDQLDEFTSRPFAYRIMVKAAPQFEFSGHCGETVEVLRSEIFTPLLSRELDAQPGPDHETLPGEVISCLVPTGATNALTISFALTSEAQTRLSATTPYIFAVWLKNPSTRSDITWELFLNTANSVHTFSSSAIGSIRINQFSQLAVRLLHQQLPRELADPLLNAAQLTAFSLSQVNPGGSLQVSITDGFIFASDGICPVIEGSLVWSACEVSAGGFSVHLTLSTSLHEAVRFDLVLSVVAQELSRGLTYIPSTLWLAESFTGNSRGLDRGARVVPPLSPAVEAFAVWSNFTDANDFHGFDLVTDVKVSILLKDAVLPGETLEISWPANWPSCEDIQWNSHSFSVNGVISVTCESRTELLPLRLAVFVVDVSSGSLPSKEPIILNFPSFRFPAASLADALNQWTVAHLREDGEFIATGALPAWVVVPQISEVSLRIVSGGVTTEAVAVVQLKFTALRDANYLFVFCTYPTTTTFDNAKSPNAQLVRVPSSNAVELRVSILGGVETTVTFTNVILGHIGRNTLWTLKTANEIFNSDGTFYFEPLDEGVGLVGFNVAQTIDDIKVSITPWEAEALVSRGNKGKLELDVRFPLTVNPLTDWIRIRFLQPWTTHTFAVVGSPDSAEFEDEGRGLFVPLKDVASGVSSARTKINNLAMYLNSSVEPIDPSTYGSNTRISVEVYPSRGAMDALQSSNGTTQGVGALHSLIGQASTVRFPPSAVNEIRLEISSGLISGSFIDSLEVSLPPNLRLPASGCLSALADNYSPVLDNGRGIIRARACREVSESVFVLHDLKVEQVRLSNYVPVLMKTSPLYGIFAFKVETSSAVGQSEQSFSVQGQRQGVPQAWGRIVVPPIRPLEQFTVSLARVPTASEVMQVSFHLAEAVSAGTRLTVRWSPAKTLRMRCEFSNFFRSSYETLFATGKQAVVGPLAHSLEPSIGAVRDCVSNDELGELSFAFVERQSPGTKFLGWLVQGREAGTSTTLSLTLVSPTNITIASIYDVALPAARYGVTWRLSGWSASPKRQTNRLLVAGAFTLDLSKYTPSAARVFRAVRLRLEGLDVLSVRSVKATGFQVARWTRHESNIELVLAANTVLSDENTSYGVNVELEVNQGRDLSLSRYFVDLCEAVGCPASGVTTFVVVVEPPVTTDLWETLNSTTTTTPPPFVSGCSGAHWTFALAFATLVGILIN